MNDECWITWKSTLPHACQKFYLANILFTNYSSISSTLRSSRQNSKFFKKLYSKEIPNTVVFLHLILPAKSTGKYHDQIVPLIVPKNKQHHLCKKFKFAMVNNLIWNSADSGLKKAKFVVPLAGEHVTVTITALEFSYAYSGEKTSSSSINSGILKS